MQGTAIAGLTIAMGNIEAAETAAGPGLRMSSRQQSETKSTLFTEILNHKENVLEIQAKAGLRTGEETAGSADETDDGYGANSDVCGLLMQLLLMNSASSGQQVRDENPGASELGAANSVVDNLAAATVTLQTGETPSAAEPAVLAEPPVPADAAAEEADVKQGIPSAFGVGLMEAMAKASQFEGEKAAQDVAGASQILDAGSASYAAVQEQAQVPAVQPDGDGTDAAGSLKNTFGQAVIAAALNSGVQNGRTDAIGGPNKVQTEEPSAVQSGVLTNSAETAEDTVLTNVSAADEEQTGDGMGELPPDDDKGAALGRDKSGAAILNRTFTNTSYGGADAAETASAVEKAFNRFVDDVRSLETGVNQVKIVLEPESLGTMIITVVRTENGITAKINADNERVCEAISGQIHKLISSLESSGIHVENMDVSYSQTEQGFGRQSFSGGRDERAREQGRLQDAGSGGNDYAEVAEAPGESAEANTLLEYRL